MINYLAIVTNLLTQIWFFPLLALISLGIYHNQKDPPKIPATRIPPKNNGIGIWLGALISFLTLSAPYWIFGSNAPHGGSDDSAITLQTYLSTSHSMNWTNNILGGMDRWLLPNCHPFALGRIYALFLKPYQLYLLVMGINVVAVFIFSWKIQTEFLGMRRWLACIGSVVSVIVEGYWTGKFPDAHVSNGHGFAIIIVSIYWLTRFHQSSKFWIIALLTGLAIALGSWVPFHNLPLLLVTISIWGLLFWGRGAWTLVFQANILIITIFSLVLLPQIMAMKLLFGLSGRSEIFRPTVDLYSFYSIPEIIALGILGISGWILKIYDETNVKKVLAMFLWFCTIPAIAYLFQFLQLMPSFRWELLYTGNDAWLWIAIIFFMGKLQEALAERSRLAGIFSKVLLLSVWWTLIVFACMTSWWIDLNTSYPAGTWKSLMDTSISFKIKEIDHEPMRVVGIDDSNDMHFWGQYQGLESMLGYTPFIDKRKAYFWWFNGIINAMHGFYAPGYLSIPIPAPGHLRNLDFPVRLSDLINPNALKLANVRWIISHHPLYPMPGLRVFLQHPGQSMACAQESPIPGRLDPKEISDYWSYISCLVKDYHFDRPLYVYDITDTLPRAYLAAHVNPWTNGQYPILTIHQLALAAQKDAYIDPQEMLPKQDLNVKNLVSFDVYESDYMRLKISTGQQNALLIISSTLNPYWHVRVDGRPVHSFDVNGFQTGFWVHQNDQKAELIYCPPWRLQKDPHC